MASIFNFFNQTQHKILRHRFSAFFLDLLAITILSKMTFWTYNRFLKNFMTALPAKMHALNAGHIYRIEILVFSVFFWGYFVFSYYMMNGQSPGKVLFNLQVKNSNPEHNPHLSLSTAMLRTLGYFLCYFSGSFLFLLPFFNKNQKGIPDWLSQTEVGILSNTRPQDSASTEVMLFDANFNHQVFDHQEFPGQRCIQDQGLVGKSDEKSEVKSEEMIDEKKVA